MQSFKKPRELNGQKKKKRKKMVEAYLDSWIRRKFFIFIFLRLEGCREKLEGERDVNLEEIREEREKCYK